jgi:CTP:phosphocholine cytidylyltransferase-like protein
MHAIIMAAGMGSRLRPHTDSVPKALVPVEGRPIIERQIACFLERGADEIIVVSGYKSGAMDYLAVRFPRTRIVFNDKYDVYNNVYSMHLVRERLGGGYVSEADVFMHENYLLEGPETSLIFGGPRAGFAKEWIIRSDADGRIRRIDVQGGRGIIQAGLSYWTPEDGAILRTALETRIASGGFAEAYWDDIFMAQLDRVRVYLRLIEASAWTEIDAPSDLELAAERERARRTGTPAHD